MLNFADNSITCFSSENPEKDTQFISSDKVDEFIYNHIPEEDLLGFIHYNEEVIDADRNGKSPYDFSETVVNEIKLIKKRIEEK